MADNVAITAGSGTTIATREIGGEHYQLFGVGFNAATATIANAATVSDAVDTDGFGNLALILPAAFTGTTIYFEVSHDGVTYVDAYTQLGERVALLNVVASRAYPLPGEISAYRYIKLEAGTAQAASRSIVVSMRSL